MAIFLMILAVIAGFSGWLCFYVAGTWRRRARWWAEASPTAIAAASEGKLTRVTGKVLPSGQVGPLSGRAAALWRVDLFEFIRMNTPELGDTKHHIHQGGGVSLAIADDSGATAMLDSALVHLLFIEQRKVTKLEAKGAPTAELNALCQRLGQGLHVDPRSWRAEAQERIIAPGTSIHAIGQAQIDGKTVWLKPMKGAPESSFATQYPQVLSTRRLWLMGAGAALLVAGLALLLLGIWLLD